MKTIDDLVRGSTDLRQRADGTYIGQCPFHGDRTPSFMVYPATQTFHCFGCGTGGDAFSFVMKRDDVDFKTAVDLLSNT